MNAEYPQQARLVELLATDRGLAIACTVIDSAAPAGYHGSGPGRPGGPASGAGFRASSSPARLAALSRELAANDWQVRDLITAEGGAGAGTAADRNGILALDWPRRAAA